MMLAISDRCHQCRTPDSFTEDSAAPDPDARAWSALPVRSLSPAGLQINCSAPCAAEDAFAIADLTAVSRYAAGVAVNSPRRRSISWWFAVWFTAVDGQIYKDSLKAGWRRLLRAADHAGGDEGRGLCDHPGRQRAGD